MSKKLVCHIPGNVQLTIENHSKLMTLIYTYGVDGIATLLERAHLLLNESNNLPSVDHFTDLATSEENHFEDAFEGESVIMIEEFEQSIQLQNLAEAFKELKVTPAIMLELESQATN